MELLQRRPVGLPCRFAARRRPLPASRLGTRLGVIVPSRDNASGSSDSQDMPLLWTHLKKLELEDTYKRAAAEPAYAIQPPEPSVDAPPCSRPDLDAEEIEALEQRRASSTHASTSDNNGSSSWRLTEGDSLMLSEASTRELQAVTSMSLATGHSSHAAINGSSSNASANGVAHSSTFTGLSHSSAHAPHATTWHELAGARSHQADAPLSLPTAGTHTHQLTSSLNGASSNGHHSQAPPTSVALREGTGAAAAPVAPQAESQPVGGSNPSDIPRPIWILCCISAALTCASCVFNTALPVYMVSELKMSMRSMGMFEGLLEAFSYVVRMCSGIVSDRMTSRKAAITLGFAAGAAAKFGMASASTVGLLFAGKAVDRLANGIQAAPRDALIGDLSPKGVQSACFGLAQSLRKWGSAVGALAAFFLMKASNNNYQLIFYSASAVSLAACIAFVCFVPAHARVPTPAAPAAAAATAAASSTGAAASAVAEGSGKKPGFLHGAKEFLKSVSSMGTDFYRMLGVICMYALGHINESLLEARAMEVGFGKAEATLVVAAIAAVTFMTAYPLGRLDDKYGAGTTFAVGIGALIAGDLVLLLSGTHPVALFVSCMFLGVHWAVIQGPLLSIVSGLAPAHLRGTAFGIFYTVMAVTAVGANTMYGTLWHMYGANAAFATSAALMSVVLLALPHLLPASARKQRAVAAPAAPAPTKGGPSGGAPGLGSPLPAAA